MIINSSIIAGSDLEFIEEGHILIEDARIVEVNDGFVPDGIDSKGYISMPSLINAHTHIGDSFAKEAVLGMDLGSAVGKNGLKWSLYRNVRDGDVISCMRDAAVCMLNSGTAIFADFREGGISGINLLKTALTGIPIKTVVLGRDIDIGCCEGLGINTYQIDQIPEDRKDKLIAIHAGESGNEIEIAMNHNPDIIIHFTNATKEEIKKTAKNSISVVVCPRSNASMGVGIPKVREMLNAGINVAIGTDNVMINSPDMFREMEFISKLSYLNDPVSPEEILKMATINGANALGINSGLIEKGRDADIILIDKNAPNLRFNKNILATIIHRCEPENVRKVMIDGRFIIDKDL